MSRTKQRRRTKIERAGMGVMTNQGMYGGSGGSVTIPANMLMQIMANQAPQKDKTELFAPGAPLEPVKGMTPAAGPRQWAYPLGVNLSGVDRTLGIPDIPSFQQLRTLSMNYSGINLAERVWCDLIPRMKIKITLRDGLKEDGMEDKNFQALIKKYMTFFEKPDGFDDYHDWLRKAVVDQTQVDGLVIYKRRTRGGQLLGLDIVDCATIKPLLDERGRVPIPPYPAYQQYPYGVPGEMYNTDQMIYYRESPRSFTPYGFSRVERIMLTVNQALRKQNKDLARWTDGNIPAGIMQVPETSNWTPDQIDTYEQLWNALIAGNSQAQVRVKFTQPGFVYNKIDEEIPSTEFDKFLLNLTLSSYGLGMADVGFTEDIHKSADAGQQNMLYRRTIDPIAIAYGRIFSNVIRDDFHDDRFQVIFDGYNEDEDLVQEVTAYNMAVGGGLISPKDAATKLGFPDLIDTGPLIYLATGPVPLTNFEVGSKFRAAAEVIALTPPPIPGQDESKPRQSEKKPAQSKPANDETQRAISADYRRWRDIALKDVKAGKPVRTFMSEVIPPAECNRIDIALQACTTPDEVRMVFKEDSLFLEALDKEGNGESQAPSNLLWSNTPLS